MRFFHFLSLLLHFIKIVYCEGERLIEPEIVESVNGILDITLTIQYATWTQNGTNFVLRNTRLLNGSLPGPTLRISPNDTLRILFKNELELQPDAVNSGSNVIGYPDHSNLHFHGGHVSGELPSDDVRLKVEPQSSYQYETKFPKNHMGGTQWIHPHVHGSSALQVGGGAALALIVRDEDETLPIEVANATEVLLMIQDIDPEMLQDVRGRSGDKKLSITNDPTLPGRWRIVNGQYQPLYNMTTNEWYRFRIIHGGWLKDPLNLRIPNCNMELLAMDGLYIRDFPRTITDAPIPPGGRADIMVQCATSGNFTMTDFAGQTVMTLEVSDGDDDLAEEEGVDLPSWTPAYPDYLLDLQNAEVTDGCSCETQFLRCEDGKFCVNGELFEEESYIHSIPFGSIVERSLLGMRQHPYHQHVHPFQIVENLREMNGRDSAYWKVGDWHDVWQSRSGEGILKMRFPANVHLGRLMVHCHALDHEDEGTMSQEYISSSASCDCSARAASQPPQCFSSTSTVIEEKEGEIKLKDLVVGQKVLTGSGNFQTIYTIDHKNPNYKAEFIQIHYKGIGDDDEYNQILEITKSHMVFKYGKKEPVPAFLINVGDKLQALHKGGAAIVTQISNTKREGVWNPLTVDGTIVVDGIVSSVYSATFGNEFDRDEAVISHQKFMHLLMRPLRTICAGISLSLCENHNDHDKIFYSWLGASILNLGLQQHPIIQYIMFLCIFVTFSVINFIIGPLGIAAILTYYFQHYRFVNKSSPIKNKGQDKSSC